MCGIAGYFQPNTNADEAVVRRMCARIRHRGPDDEGYHVDSGCAIGMRRLSIVDLNTGHQPISNEDGSVWVVFNGEIYNYRELRNDLLARGHCMRTHSDTEILVHLYEDQGIEGIARLRGMFAYALWDGRRKKLILVRDRFGKKPLYYAITPSGITFASELKCFRETEVPLETDERAIRLYLFFGYIPDPDSPFRGIKKLAPGGWLTYDAAGRVETGRYWRLPTPAERCPDSMDRRETIGKVREVFDESVKMRMMADVPLGAFLSGGIDSSSVVASMALQSGQPVKTFSIGFEEAEYNELDAARLVAEQYRTEHHEIVVKPDATRLVERLAEYLDEPFGDSSAIPTFIVSEFASKHVKVVLTGDGGDELFAGYDSFFKVEQLRKWDRVPQAARRLIARIASALPYSAYGKNYLWMISRPDALSRYFEMNHSPYMLRKRLLREEWMLPEDPAFLRREFAGCLAPAGSAALTQALYFEATAKLTGDMLVKVDRMSMANSIEVRCPMLDHRLAELAMRIGPEWKMVQGRGKAIFLDAVGDRLPRALLGRKKMGFAVPLPIWFRGPLREFLRDHVAGKRFRERGIVEPGFVEQMIREHESGRRDNSARLWYLLMLELWYESWHDSANPV
jgi:asparagine synthase (glutamine-hydrolysing)